MFDYRRVVVYHFETTGFWITTHRIHGAAIYANMTGVYGIHVTIAAPLGSVMGHGFPPVKSPGRRRSGL